MSKTIGFLILIINVVYIKPDDGYEEQNDKELKKLTNIKTLDDKCVGSICRDFLYSNSSEIAYFDLDPEIRLAADTTTNDNTNKNYEMITFVNSTFVNFPLNLFYWMQVSELDMRNCSIQTMTWENFIMADKLKILLLSYNRLSVIEEMTFKFSSELEFLFLDANRLRRLESDTFFGLNKLRYLDLSRNRLKALPARIFDALENLSWLNLEENRLRVIRSELFLQNQQLSTLKLNSNHLHAINDDSFQAQKHMTALDLSHNHELDTLITNVNVDHLWAANCSLYRINIYGSVESVDLRDNHIMELYFSQPQDLKTLILRNNALIQISSLSGATNLQFLDLADNPDLGELPVPWLANSLERLDLSNTSLKTLPIASLVELTNLRKLNVSTNQLSEINPSYFEYLRNLTHFYIDGNDWNCYNLNTIMDLLIRPNGISYSIDNLDPEFPGEYINGIACMYRLESAADGPSNIESESFQTFENNAQLIADPAQNEIADLRKELKAIVQIYDQKFDRVFEKLQDLKEKLSTFERINSSLWNSVTISV